MRGLWVPRLRRPEDFDSFDLHSNSSIKICKSVRVKCCSANKLHQGFQSSPQWLKICSLPWPGLAKRSLCWEKKASDQQKLDHGDSEVRINDSYSWEHSVTTLYSAHLYDFMFENVLLTGDIGDSRVLGGLFWLCQLCEAHPFWRSESRLAFLAAMQVVSHALSERKLSDLPSWKLTSDVDFGWSRSHWINTWPWWGGLSQRNMWEAQTFLKSLEPSPGSC